jgi:hypothetical protein
MMRAPAPREAIAVLALAMGCGGEARSPSRTPSVRDDPRADATSFLVGSLRPWPRSDSPGLLAITEPATGRIGPYDSALVALAMLRVGDRDRAGRILLGLAALQTDDGGLPFSFTLPQPNRSRRYERSGTIAWVGYAAVEYVDAADGGDARDEALALAHRAAAYLLRRQVDRAGDPRDGLVLGGAGTVYYVSDAGERDGVREGFVPGELSWASVEHNVDAYFFLRALARITNARVYADGADRIARALKARGWSAAEGQLVQGLGEGGPDDTPALDCASWGSVFLSSIGEVAEAQEAASTADGRYGTTDRRSGARGHRPYAEGPVIENVDLLHRFASALPADRWDRLDVIWPEGSAGVALAEWRTGHVDRARAIIDALEPLRASDGSLPTATVEVPFTLDTLPSVAGTAWVALVRFEIERPVSEPTLWP